jgi:DNA-3-methyladenine glycosylase I
MPELRQAARPEESRARTRLPVGRILEGGQVLREAGSAKKRVALVRCDWAKNDLAIAYHDSEWGVPQHDDRVLFEFLILEGAQAGLSWDTILRKRENYRAAFDNFDPAKIARYKQRKLDTLMRNEGIIRNRLKILSAVKNAKAFLDVQKEFGSFDAYVWQFVGGKPQVNSLSRLSQLLARTAESDAMSKDLKKRGFGFVGSTICYAFMQAVGMVNDHLVTCFRYREVQRVNGPIPKLVASGK